MSRKREEEIRQVTADLAGVIEELETVVAALAAMSAEPEREGEEEGDPA
jgi:hypothetical protein